MPSIDERFDAAVQLIESLPPNVSLQEHNGKLLHLYGLYKQGSCGRCNEPRPRFWDIRNKAKWNAWNGQRHLSKYEAKVQYLAELEKMMRSIANTPQLAELVKGLAASSGTLDFDQLDFIIPGMREICETNLSPELLAHLKDGHRDNDASGSSSSLSADKSSGSQHR